MKHDQAAVSTTISRPPVNLMTDDAAPVFLVGATRSGTTLLRLMMDHHPWISNFGEFEYAVHEITAKGLPALNDYYRYLELDRMYRVRSWKIDRSLDYVSLVRSFLQQAADQAGKPLVGATVHSKFDQLTRIWPQARFIHIVRDPRDVARSCIGMGWTGNVYYGTEYWIEPNRRWQRLSSILPESRKLELRYEDLILDTRKQLERICHFMGTEYDDAMMSYPDHSTYTLPEPSLIEQWKRKLNGNEIRLIESVCHPMMEQFGYVPVSTKLARPAGLKKLCLTVDHRWKRIVRNVSVYGLPRYLAWQVAKKLPYCSVKRRLLRSKDQFDQARLK